jgi:cytochrome c oxidase cbb3-type subunit 2
MFESKSGILFIAGIGFFVFAFLSNGALPMMMFKDLPEKTAEEVVNPRIMTQFRDLADRYPEAFQKAFGEASEAKCAEALRLGRQIYVGEGCWHCHSQFIRPVSNESLRWGPVSKTEEYQNELQRPVLFGTRRVGPDLIREGGRRSNDWHVVHFFRPKTVSADSPMPEYPWFFESASPTAADPKAPKTEDLPKLAPNRRGLALITYIQWLGSWQESYPYYEELNEIKTSE